MKRNDLNLEPNPALAAYLRCMADFGPNSGENAWLRRQAARIERG